MKDAANQSILIIEKSLLQLYREYYHMSIMPPSDNRYRDNIMQRISILEKQIIQLTVLANDILKYDPNYLPSLFAEKNDQFHDIWNPIHEIVNINYPIQTKLNPSNSTELKPIIHKKGN